MVRTHPLTGWKTIWGFGIHVRYVEDLTAAESEELLQKITRMVSDNHDMHVRLRWSNSGDIGKPDHLFDRTLMALSSSVKNSS